MSPSSSPWPQGRPLRNHVISSDWRPRFYPLFAAPPGFNATANPHGNGPPFTISEQILYIKSPATITTLQPHPSPGKLITLPAEILLQIYSSLSPIDQRKFGLTCKHAGRLAMQSGVKPYTTWHEAMSFFLSLQDWLNRDGKWCWWCERCWVYHRCGSGWCDGRKRKKKSVV